LLVTLQKDRAEAAVSDTSSKIAALKITLTRLQAEVNRKPLKFKADLLSYGDYIRNQTDLYNNRQTALNEDIESLRGMLRLALSELNINRKLEQTGDVSQAEILRLERQS
jgi:adhesin transport system membrane fusion protein